MPESHSVTQLVSEHFLDIATIGERTGHIGIERHIAFSCAKECRPIDDARIGHRVERYLAGSHDPGAPGGRREMGIAVVERDRVAVVAAETATCG